jgi:hypothetical protein
MRPALCYGRPLFVVDTHAIDPADPCHAYPGQLIRIATSATCAAGGSLSSRMLTVSMCVSRVACMAAQPIRSCWKMLASLETPLAEYHCARVSMPAQATDAGAGPPLDQARSRRTEDGQRPRSDATLGSYTGAADSQSAARC